MDYKTIFTYEVLPHIETEKPSISLKKCSSLYLMKRNRRFQNNVFSVKKNR